MLEKGLNPIIKLSLGLKVLQNQFMLFFKFLLFLFKNFPVWISITNSMQKENENATSLKISNQGKI